jgi:glyoxylase-like metal-dependent hydrolase (beta-lactamase superfamily II)
LLADAESVDIVLTHFHLDHVVDLSYLPALPLREPPTILVAWQVAHWYRYALPSSKGCSVHRFSQRRSARLPAAMREIPRRNSHGGW